MRVYEQIMSKGVRQSPNQAEKSLTGIPHNRWFCMESCVHHARLLGAVCVWLFPWEPCLYESEQGRVPINRCGGLEPWSSTSSILGPLPPSWDLPLIWQSGKGMVVMAHRLRTPDLAPG